MRTTLSIVIVALVVMATPAHASEATQIFDRLKELAGEWEGTYQWIGRDQNPMRATYEITGGGSAVIETLYMSGDRVGSMTTVYHLDGDTVRMTHYCMARNQPRLKASTIDAAAGFVAFEFVDAINVTPARPAHVHAADLRLHDANRLTLRFTVSGGSEPPATEQIELTRKTR